MKRTFKTLGLFLSAFFLLTACSSNEEDDNLPVDENANKTFPVIEDKLDPAVVSFFNETLPNQPCYQPIETFFTPVSEETNAYSLINNEQELREAYKGDKALPKIDFEHYTLIIGRVYTGGVKVDQQYLTKENENNVLVLHLLHEAVVAEMFYTYYWGVYPKMTTDHITIQLVYEK